MNKWKLSILIFVSTLGLLANTPLAQAMTDSYYASGEDLEIMSEDNEISAIEEIEYELRRIPLVRVVEDFVFNLQDKYTADEN